MNKQSTKFSRDVRNRAVRLVQEHRCECPSLLAAIESIAPKIGCTPQTIKDWVNTGIALADRSLVSSAVKPSVFAQKHELTIVNFAVRNLSRLGNLAVNSMRTIYRGCAYAVRTRWTKCVP
jgi:transposase-like protein